MTTLGTVLLALLGLAIVAHMLIEREWLALFMTAALWGAVPIGHYWPRVSERFLVWRWSREKRR